MLYCRCVQLIDFGKAIDLTLLPPDVVFDDQVTLHNIPHFEVKTHKKLSRAQVNQVEKLAFCKNSGPIPNGSTKYFNWLRDHRAELSSVK